MKSELLALAKPILFNTPMVQAILDGRKTVTRRAIKPQAEGVITDRDGLPVERLVIDGIEGYCRCDPPCKKGDILYVRETWYYLDIIPSGAYLFKAHKTGETTLRPNSKWRPSIHMPKEAARIFLRVTAVRAERLQDITEQATKAEGMSETEIIKAWNSIYKQNNSPETLKTLFRTISHNIYVFKNLWNSINAKRDNGAYAWEANPWVWVIEFERISDNDEN